MSAFDLLRYLYRIERARGLGRVRSIIVAIREINRPMPF